MNENAENTSDIQITVFSKHRWKKIKSLILRKAKRNNWLCYSCVDKYVFLLILFMLQRS